jgi:acyl-coenzyme A synthetase/AMP-(fatty) acid ligase
MTSLTWQRFETLSLALAERLRPELRQGHFKIGIDQKPILEGLLLLAAGAALGLDIVFEEKTNLNSNELGLFVPSRELLANFQLEFQNDFSPQIPKICFDGKIPATLKSNLRNRTFYFSTSGSTGDAKAIGKSIEGLLTEVEELKKLYQLKNNSKIVSLVRPFHIYGFLHSFLLPLMTDSTAIYWPVQSVLASLENGFPESPAMLITVPAHWNLIKKIWSETRTEQVVSSAAIFGKERTRELEHYRKSFDHYHEILGSTETGGIGYRLLEEDQAFFTAFKGIHLESHSDGTKIFSPFLYPAQAVVSSDRLEIQDPVKGTFAHLGRSDRIFKYAGLRHSLCEVEDLLKALSEASQVIAAFDEDERVPQGGILSAWIESDGSQIDLKTLQLNYLAKSSCPYPRRIHLLATFPRDAQGKVSIKQLKASMP